MGNRVFFMVCLILQKIIGCTESFAKSRKPLADNSVIEAVTTSISRCLYDRGSWEVYGGDNSKL